jgi:hypothetical protein
MAAAPLIGREYPMHKYIGVAGLAAMLCLAAPGVVAQRSSAAKNGTEKIVIVFKDGHRQSFNLADVARVEFPGGGETPAASTALPSRGHFLGRWEVGEGNGQNFYITLKENGEALRSIGSEHGKWVYVDGEARVTWDDGWLDVIRKVGPVYEKFAYGSGKTATDTPDNVTNARNTTPHPI